MPDSQKLPDTATGQQAIDASETLSPSTKGELYKANIKLSIAKEQGQTDRYKAMCEADNQETRAAIVNKAMNGLIALSVIYILALAYCMVVDSGIAFDTLTYAFAAVSAPLAYVIRAYFGDLRTETESRHQSINGLSMPAKGIAGLVKAYRHG